MLHAASRGRDATVITRGGSLEYGAADVAPVLFEFSFLGLTRTLPYPGCLRKKLTAYRCKHCRKPLTGYWRWMPC